MHKVLAMICTIGLLLVLLSCNISLNIAVTFGLTASLFFLSKAVYRIHVKRFPVFLFFSTFTLFLIIVFAIRSPQVSDFALLVDSARQFMNGNADAVHGAYFKAWPHLSASTAINVLLLSIVDSVTFIKICEAAASSGICVFTYLILREITTSKLAMVGGFALAVFPLFAFSVEMVNNQILSAFFCMSAYTSAQIILLQIAKLQVSRKGTSCPIAG